MMTWPAADGEYRREGRSFAGFKSPPAAWKGPVRSTKWQVSRRPVIVLMFLTLLPNQWLGVVDDLAEAAVVIRN